MHRRNYLNVGIVFSVQLTPMSLSVQSIQFNLIAPVQVRIANLKVHTKYHIIWQSSAHDIDVLCLRYI